LLTHLGGLAPTGGLYVLDKAYDDPAAYATWLERARPVVAALTVRAGPHAQEGAPVGSVRTNGHFPQLM